MISKLLPLISSPRMSLILRSGFAQVKRRKYSSNAPIYEVSAAVKFAKVHAVANFEETIDVSIVLNVDPKRGDHLVRGSCVMPSGLGKKIIVAVHCEPHLHEQAKAAGADVIVTEETRNDIKKTIINFDKLLCTHGCISDLKPFAKILGPRGLMPNQKSGTLVTENALDKTIKDSKMGFVDFRVDSGSNVHVPIGKRSFSEKDLLVNLKALMEVLSEKKPEKLKGKYILSAFVSSTMGPSFRMDVESLDPKSKTYALGLI